MKPLICADCKWHIPSDLSTPLVNYDKCRASEVISLITGEHKYTYCETMRVAGGTCDLVGKLFELNQDEVTNGN